MLVLLRYGTSRILRLLLPKEVSCAVKAKFLCCGTPAEAQRLDYSVSTRYGSVEQVLWRISRTPGAVVHRFSHSSITIVTFPPSLLFLFGTYAYEHHQAQVAHLKEVLQELRKGPNGSRRPLIWLAGDGLHVRVYWGGWKGHLKASFFPTILCFPSLTAEQCVCKRLGNI